MNLLKNVVPGFLKWDHCSLKLLCTSSTLNVKVAVIGSSGAVGQPMSLLLKMLPYIDELTLYDLDCAGVGGDLSHINTRAKVKWFTKEGSLGEAIEKRDIVVIAAGKERSPGTVCTKLFEDNVKPVVEAVECVSKSAPEAILCLMTNPINCLLPVAAGILGKAKVNNPKKLFGITTLDCVRASTFAAELLSIEPSKLSIPVIGGHSSQTTVPVFSQSSTPIDLPKDKLQSLIERVRNAGQVVDTKENDATSLSTAYAGARFVLALCRALKGEKNIVECAMIQSDLTDAAFFTNPLLLGENGVNKNLGYGKLTKGESGMLDDAVKYLIKDIEIGTKFLEADNKNENKLREEPKHQKGSNQQMYARDIW